MREISLLLFVLLIYQCGDSPEESTAGNKIKSTIHYYRLKEWVAGKEFHQFNYMYSLTEKEIHDIGDYYKVFYNQYKKIVSSNHYVQKELQKRIAYFYLSSGKLQKILVYKKKKLFATIKYEYDGDREIKVIHNDQNHHIVKKRVSIYAKDRLVRQDVYDKNDKKMTETKFEYNEKGALSKQKVFQGTHLVKTKFYEKKELVREEIYRAGAPDKAINYYYDDQKKVVKENHFRGGFLNYFVLYGYNESKDRISVKFYDRDNKPNGKWLFLNNKGNLTLEKIYKKGKHLVDNRFTYNKTSQLIKLEKYNEKKKLLEKEIYHYKNGIPILRERFKNNEFVKRELFKKGKWVAKKK